MELEDVKEGLRVQSTISGKKGRLTGRTKDNHAYPEGELRAEVQYDTRAGTRWTMLWALVRIYDDGR
jgi:hypothetical protein